LTKPRDDHVTIIRPNRQTLGPDGVEARRILVVLARLGPAPLLSLPRD